MAQKKPYEIRTASDGITSLTISGLTEMFRTVDTRVHWMKWSTCLVIGFAPFFLITLIIMIMLLIGE